MLEQCLKLEDVLRTHLPSLESVFYRDLEGFQDPFGDGRRLFTRRHIDDTLSELGLATESTEARALIRYILENTVRLPPPVDLDYRKYRSSGPFGPHLICFALGYLVFVPSLELLKPFTILVVETGWWAGDENCIADILNAFHDDAAICRIAADSLLERISENSVFAAGQLLYHLRYGADVGMHAYVKAKYQEALRIPRSQPDAEELKRRLASGLKPWNVLKP